MLTQMKGRLSDPKLLSQYRSDDCLNVEQSDSDLCYQYLACFQPTVYNIGEVKVMVPYTVC